MVACGQLQRGSPSLGTLQGYFPAPSPEAPHRHVLETPGPMGHANATCIIPRAGGDRGTARLAFPVPAPHLLSECVPEERNLRMPKQMGRMEEGLQGQHPHGPSASSRCLCHPQDPLCCQGASPLCGHRGVDGISQQLLRDPECRRPLARPPQLWETFQVSRWGRGAAAARRRAEKAIFSRYIFYKLNILCISALPGKASRAQPRDSASEPVSQQQRQRRGRSAQREPGQRGSPLQRVWLRGPPDPMMLEEHQDGPTTPPSPPSLGTASAANSACSAAV